MITILLLYNNFVYFLSLNCMLLIIYNNQFQSKIVLIILYLLYHKLCLIPVYYFV